MQLIRSLIYSLIFYPATALFVFAGLSVTSFGPRPTRAVVRAWTVFHYWLVRTLLGVTSEIEGQVPDGAVLIAVKHQSMFETLEMERIAETPAVVMKRELAQIPFFGWLTRRYGNIPVDRAAGPKALRELLVAGRKAIASERAILIFPEGTRVPPGETPPLRAGFAGLYRALGLPVVPVAVDSGRVWPRGLVKGPGTVRFKIGETIPPGLKREEIESRVHSAINAFEL